MGRGKEFEDYFDDFNYLSTDNDREYQEEIIEEIYEKVLRLNGKEKESICYLLGELKGLI